jgi:hypothetical protein
MKRFISILTLLATTGTALALLVGRFTSWNNLIEQSPDIIIARCTATQDGMKPEPTNFFGNVFCSDIEVISVLKGNAKLGLSHLTSLHRPLRGEHYLMFASFESNQVYTGYSAIEEYRLVPINVPMSSYLTNALASKTLKEKVNLILSWRLKELNDELVRDNEEKARMELDLSSNAPPPQPPSLNGGKKF